MRYFSTDIPSTASELFDGELVIAHYGSGLYYAVSATGSVIWQGLRAGLADTEVADWLVGAYPAQSADIAQFVPDFIAGLETEGLLLPAGAPAAAAPLPDLAMETLALPLLERFDDLQQLLLLDPVHDVAEGGWPRRAED